MKKSGDDQPSLPGFEPVAPSGPVWTDGKSDSFYFALRPDSSATKQIEAIGWDLERRLGLQGTWVKPENFHVTLHPFWRHDGVPQDLVDVASRFAGTIRGAPFNATFNMAMRFGRSVVLCGTDGTVDICDLQRQFNERFKPLIKNGAQKTPHITLFYGDNAVEKQPIEPVSWAVLDFVLIHSFYGQARQEIMARWPLGV
jgi:RNA 2',3'-cyclic 3'-phosphodiesterase